MIKNLRGFVLPAVFLVAAVLLLPLMVGGNPVRTPTTEQPKAVGDPHGFAGNSTCSGRGCHGAITTNQGDGPRQDEYNTFIRYDKHANAFKVLKSDRARRMAENLRPTNMNPDQIIPAHEDARCLACHSTPEYANETSKEMRDIQALGISCETCHGAARKGGDGWLTAHTTPEWRALNSAAKEKQGMHMLGDPQAQAKACVGCHVGAPAKDGRPAQDLNHDLMAAGHPRLVFEMSTYRANMPAHWRTDKYKGDRAYEVKTWAFGRVESARASLDLLAYRASTDTQRPWPELAESSCFACHANFAPQRTDWRQRPGYRDSSVRGPGALPYNAWFATGLSDLAMGLNRPSEIGAKFKTLSAGMSRAMPSRGEAKDQVNDCLTELAALKSAIATTRFDDQMIRDIRKTLAESAQKKAATLSWDETTQLVYGLAVLSDAAPPKDDGDRRVVKDQFTKLYAALAFPQGDESPADFRRAEATKQSDRLTAELAELLRLLGAEGP